MTELKKLTIGFLGAGQLAAMSAQAALKLGHHVLFYADDLESPCKEFGKIYEQDFSLTESIEKFYSSCDIITLENEFIPLNILKFCQKKLFPSLETFEKIRTKIDEKKTAQELEVPTTQWGEFVQGLSAQQLPFMLKTSLGGYDGYGNVKVTNDQELELTLNKFSGKKLLWEELVDFEREVAITIARNVSGQTISYPVVDTIQENNICTRVIVPSSLPPRIKSVVETYSIKLIEGFKGVGIFTFEFFITHSGEVLFNECAPRPHNSCHYSMNASQTSQFENHIRAITGTPLGESTMNCQVAVMLNILGNRDALAHFELDQSFLKREDVNLHLYNKRKSRLGRKMGHINLIGNSSKELLDLSDQIERRIKT